MLMLSLQLTDNPECILKAGASRTHGQNIEVELSADSGFHVVCPAVESESFYEIDRQHLDEKAGDRKTGQKICF